MQFIKVIGCNLNFSKGEREWKWSWLRCEFSKLQIKAAAFQSSVFQGTVTEPGLWYSRWNRNAIFECIPWNLGRTSWRSWAVCSQHSWEWRCALSQCPTETQGRKRLLDLTQLTEPAGNVECAMHYKLMSVKVWMQVCPEQHPNR